MLYYLSQYLLKIAADTAWEPFVSFLRLFKYITFRSGGAAVTALVLSWWLGPKMISWLKRVKFGQNYQDKAEEAGGLIARVNSKKGTPTMGGILIVMGIADYFGRGQYKRRIDELEERRIVLRRRMFEAYV